MMVSIFLTVIIVVVLTALTLWAISYMAQGRIPETPYRAIVVFVVAIAVAAIIYGYKHPIINL